jgi:hypothetical protein
MPILLGPRFFFLSLWMYLGETCHITSLDTQRRSRWFVNVEFASDPLKLHCETKLKEHELLSEFLWRALTCVFSVFSFHSTEQQSVL